MANGTVLRKGDEIAITVSKDWADAVGAIRSRVLHHFKGDDTPASQLFAAKLVSLTDSEGLWVEALGDATGKHRLAKGKMLIPWAYIYTVRSDRISESEREKIGFAKV
jgi:hypothetical protein